MSFDFAETVDVLTRTPTVLDPLLRGTSPSWHAIDEGPDTWSPLAVVGHLVHADEAVWMARARNLLEHGEERPFDSFPQIARYTDWPLDRLLDRFAELRRANLETLASWNLTEAQLAKTGRHPSLGTVTLQNLLATWAVHDLSHLAQISRVMAKRYTEDVGVWREYLSILGR